MFKTHNLKLSRDEASRILHAASSFNDKHIVVIGDVMLDRYIFGDVQRISPEAPVPILSVNSERASLGGAANVAENLKSMGASVTLYGVIGNDVYSAKIRDLCDTHGIKYHFIALNDRPTIVKTRLIAQHQQMIRMDHERIADCSNKLCDQILSEISKDVSSIDAIIVSDYGKGLITPYLIKNLVSLHNTHGFILTVDPKIEHFSLYKGLTAITPNRKEAQEGLKRLLKDDSDIYAAGKDILHSHQLEMVLITLGEKGMALFSAESGALLIPPVHKTDVFDVTGAGDTVISTFTLALACGLDPELSAVASNLAAGVVIQKIGSASLSPSELKEFVERNSTNE